MNGYIKVTVSGQEIGLKFGYPAIRMFFEAAETHKQDYFIGDNITDIGFAKLCHCAYKNNCLIKETEPALTLEDFVNWAESEDKEILANVMVVYSESTIGKKVTEEAEKKSLSQPTTTPLSVSATESY